MPRRTQHKGAAEQGKETGHAGCPGPTRSGTSSGIAKEARRTVEAVAAVGQGDCVGSL